MAYLVLSNGTVFEGRRIGAHVDRIGELVFTTGMEGYLETLTDPSYYGQIVTQTFPLIGNYGVIEEDFEGRITREEGVMNAMICDEVPSDLSAVKAFTVKDAVASVSSNENYTCPAEGQEKCRVALIDYGAKHNIIRSLQKRGCSVTVWPASTTAETILASGADGIMLSNGPGDPKENVFCIEQLKKLIGQKPVFGICLGHQLAALALGGDTIKLKYGHRGGNQPVRDLNAGRTYITSQNHGYAVVADSLKGIGKESFRNANDGSCEGMDYPDLKCFTVQFHPEAASGPRDTAILFDRFVENMVKGGKENA